ncbi:MAG: GIY-YIG nuclease family protein [bacterium]|nr:GIY-YIG nuclease family protein [bacterium]
MPFFIYVLQSSSTGKVYIGQTSDLPRRLKQHNDPDWGRRRFTKKDRGPWRLVHSEEYSTRSDAMRREKALKSGQGRQWLHDHLLSQEFNRQSPPEAD